MTATIEVCDNGHILHYVFSEPFDLADVDAINHRALTHYNSVNHKVHVIIDARQVRTLPRGFLRVRNNADLTHRNSGYIAILGPSVMLQTIGETIFRLAHFRRAKFFGSEDDAWKYIRQAVADDTLAQS